MLKNLTIERAAKEEACRVAELAFHMKSGFEEANRIICFTKKLGGFASVEIDGRLI